MLIRFATTDGREKAGGVFQRFHMTEVTEKSRYLQPYSYFVLANPETQSAYLARSSVLSALKEVVLEARFENMPLLKPLTVVPNDPLFAQQWDMTRIGAGDPGATGWDLSTGAAGVVVCVLDQGCDLAHPDLSFSAPGINLGTMLPDGSPTGNHGTACAGIVAARFNNALGVAGVAGSCQILPVAFQNWTDAEAAAGINYAADNGARVISMSFGEYLPGEGSPANWDFTIIDPAIAHAHNDRDVVLCAATGNENIGTHNRYPARHPLVIACGASDEADNRKSPTSPDGEGWWGSNYGVDTYLGQTTAVSVVAPGVHIPTTDREGADGYNPAPGVAGDYFLTFNGTSSATPHVAGLAAVVRSLNPALTNDQVRAIVERTADKVGVVPYAEVPGFPDGSRNQEMGYGRINLYRALDFADVLIKDYPADNGVEPSTPPGGDFWDFSDMVVRITDDNVFAPDDPLRSSNVERGQTNYIYVRVTNNGPNEARNVVVNCRITPFVGLQFVYPSDWAAIDATHVSPAPVVNTFSTIPSGGTAMTKFTISAAQTEYLWGWVTSHPWHPCMLASVTADNDYAFASAMFTGDPQSLLKNNLAQRNLSVIDVLAGATLAWPMVAGNRADTERIMELVFQRDGPAPTKLLLELDGDGSAFPRLDFDTADVVGEEDEDAMIFLESTRLEVTFGCCRGVLTLAKGSRFACLQQARIGKVEVMGGEVVLRGGKRYVDIQSDRTVVRIEKAPNRIYPLVLHATIPAEAVSKQQYRVRVSQRNTGGSTVGGAGVVYVVR
ncbi:S8 family serine peptidase [Rhodovastum sp. RN2-1]|uniref:S8 family serine peptidase n=1 Tax=Limobrevibacterium gyesilva TaxID=2991712 RepID=A0AA41YQF9_9PROT|nr:S8 family serine peptidase [Limobrevibacterium gyesilva]MCW3476398.1 S8 family serine peptidase [Limobrevibacterium gyesilva]